VHGILEVSTRVSRHASLRERAPVALLLLGLSHGERAGQQLVTHDRALTHAVVLGEGPGRELHVAQVDANGPVFFMLAHLHVLSTRAVGELARVEQLHHAVSCSVRLMLSARGAGLIEGFLERPDELRALKTALQT
jgi:hypothetical protein